MSRNNLGMEKNLPSIGFAVEIGGEMKYCTAFIESKNA
jgi:hypothetical protein